MRKSLAITLCGIALFMASLPAGQVRAQKKAVPIATIDVLSQPFNVISSTNAQFVLNADASVLADGRDRLEFQLHRRLSSRESLTSIANGEATSSVTDTVYLRLSRLTRDTNGNLVVTIPMLQATNNQVSLLVSQDGVYPITIRITDDITNKPIASVLTFINRRTIDSRLPTVQATTIISLTHSPSISPSGIFEVTPELRAKAQRFIDYLNKNSRAATVYVQPETIAALATSTDPNDVAIIEGIRNQLRTRSITTATFAPTDVSMMANAFLDDEFISQLRLGESTLTKYLPGINIVRNTWVANDLVDKRGIELLHKAGITGLILLHSGQSGANYQAPHGVLARPDGSSQQFMSVVSVDAELSRQLAAGALTLPYAFRAAAEIIIERDDLLAKGIAPESVRLVLASDTSSVESFDAIDIVAKAVAGSPGIKMTDMTIAQTVSADTPAINFAAQTQNNGAAIRNSLAYSRAQLTAVLSMFSDNDVSSDSLNYLLGLAGSTITSRPSAYSNGLGTELAKLRAAVSVTTPRELTLSGRNSTIRLQLRNDSKVNLTVVVRLSSVKLYLDEPVRVITLPAGSTTEVKIPATTRTNGRFPIGIKVSTPEGAVDVVPYQTITAKVNAIAGLGQLISITLLLVLIAWWWSHSRKARAEGSANEGTGTTVSLQ
jgi:hypothetical protein